MKEIIKTDTAPAAIGTYSQAVKSNGIVYISGQIPLDPKTGEVVSDDVTQQVEQTFANLKAVAQAAGGDLAQLVKLTVYLVDLADFEKVNACMRENFTEPFPARAAIGVAALPKGVKVEVEAIMHLA